MAIKLSLAAKMLKISRPKLVALLQQHHLFNQARTPTTEAIEAGLFVCEVRNVVKKNYNGHYAICLITPKGFAVVQDLMAREPEQPNARAS